MNLKSLIFILYCLIESITGDICIERYFNGENVVCVCNSTYCDTSPQLKLIENTYQIFSTSKNYLGLFTKHVKFDDVIEDPIDAVITIDKSITYQKIIGFGGAFTDSTGINLLLLPKEAQTKVLESYFSDVGLEYNMCRVPIGGTDFSIRGYSYADIENDTDLEFFQLQEEDYKYKIPLILAAKSLRQDKQLYLFASAWSAPLWMKTNHAWNGIGFLKDEYYQLWADYYLKFFDSYSANGIDFWGVTTQNEPSDGFFNVPVSSMGFTMETMKKWIEDYLGPTIRNSSHKNLKIIAHDDSRLVLPLTSLLLEENPKALEYIDGLGVHWYQDFIIPPIFLESVNIISKDIFLLGTEACSGSTFVDGAVPIDIGSWHRAENYIKDIIQDLNYNVTGWIDWNMVLDTTGGPSFVNNNVDAPILVNSTSGEFYKQPMYYVMGHFSKFLIPGSIRIKSSIEILNSHYENDIDYVTFVRPDNIVVIIIYNRSIDKLRINISGSNFKAFAVELEAQSLNTLLYLDIIEG